MKKFTAYWSAAIEGSDGKLSIRRLMSIAVLFGLIRQVETCPDNAELALVLVSLIVSLLGLTTWQNIQEKKINTNTSEQ
jgi:hypothetical protein